MEARNRGRRGRRKWAIQVLTLSVAVLRSVPFAGIFTSTMPPSDLDLKTPATSFASRQGRWGGRRCGREAWGEVGRGRVLRSGPRRRRPPVACPDSPRGLLCFGVACVCVFIVTLAIFQDERQKVVVSQNERTLAFG